jgi:hypothetical protein
MPQVRANLDTLNLEPITELSGRGIYEDFTYEGSPAEQYSNLGIPLPPTFPSGYAEWVDPSDRDLEVIETAAERYDDTERKDYVKEDGTVIRPYPGEDAVIPSQTIIEFLDDQLTVKETPGEHYSRIIGAGHLFSDEEQDRLAGLIGDIKKYHNERIEAPAGLDNPGEEVPQNPPTSLEAARKTLDEAIRATSAVPTPQVGEVPWPVVKTRAEFMGELAEEIDKKLDIADEKAWEEFSRGEAIREARRRKPQIRFPKEVRRRILDKIFKRTS